MSVEETIEALRTKLARANELQKRLDALRNADRYDSLTWEIRNDVFDRGKQLLIDEAQAELESMFAPPNQPVDQETPERANDANRLKRPVR